MKKLYIFQIHINVPGFSGYFDRWQTLLLLYFVCVFCSVFLPIFHFHFTFSSCVRTGMFLRSKPSHLKSFSENISSTHILFSVNIDECKLDVPLDYGWNSQLICCYNECRCVAATEIIDKRNKVLEVTVVLCNIFSITSKSYWSSTLSIEYTENFPINQIGF